MSGRVRCVRFRTLPERTVCSERKRRSKSMGQLGWGQRSAGSLIYSPGRPVSGLSEGNPRLAGDLPKIINLILGFSKDESRVTRFSQRPVR